MWYLKNIGEYIYSIVDNSPCFEYGNSYINEDGDCVYVPDSLHSEFIANFDVEEDFT